jgi:hypothetical protein
MFHSICHLSAFISLSTEGITLDVIATSEADESLRIHLRRESVYRAQLTVKQCRA